MRTSIAISSRNLELLDRWLRPQSCKLRKADDPLWIILLKQLLNRLTVATFLLPLPRNTIFDLHSYTPPSYGGQLFYFSNFMHRRRSLLLNAVGSPYIQRKSVCGTINRHRMKSLRLNAPGSVGSGFGRSIFFNLPWNYYGGQLVLQVLPYLVSILWFSWRK